MSWLQNAYLNHIFTILCPDYDLMRSEYRLPFHPKIRCLGRSNRCVIDEPLGSVHPRRRPRFEDDLFIFVRDQRIEEKAVAGVGLGDGQTVVWGFGSGDWGLGIGDVGT